LPSSGGAGSLQRHPGASGLRSELRDLEAAKTERIFGEIRAECERRASGGATIAFSDAPSAIPALTEPAIRRVIAGAARGLGLATRELPSMAGHDGQEMARLGPMGMIFIPSVGGISHSPKEFSRPQDIENGANVLLHTLLALDAA
jgi:N-carbamoyl-L-amino-acid hydrolase